MAGAKPSGRRNQKSRTRKDLLQAAARLVKQGRRPGLEEVAEEALVSRATAYRYFPNIEALLVEAAVDLEVPDPETFFESEPSTDPAVRLERLESALSEMIRSNEPALRTMLAHTILQGVQGGGDSGAPRRQNRRTPLIEAALAPARDQFKPADLKTLTRALALIMGPESRVVASDVLQLGDAEEEKLKRWAIRALVEAARRRKPGE